MARKVSKNLFARTIRAVNVLRRQRESELIFFGVGSEQRTLKRVALNAGWELLHAPTKFTVRQVLRAFGQKVTPETCKTLLRAVQGLWADQPKVAGQSKKAARRRRWIAKKRRRKVKKSVSPALMRWVGAYGGGIPDDWDAVVEYESRPSGKCLAVSFSPKSPVGSGKLAIVYRFAYGRFYVGDVWTVTRQTKRGRERRWIKRGHVSPSTAIGLRGEDDYNEVVAINAIPVYVFCPGEVYLPLAQKLAERLGIPLLREYKRVRFTLKEAYKPKKG